MEIKGSLITDPDDFTAFAGLEILENYDPAILKNTKNNVSRRLKVRESMKILCF